MELNSKVIELQVVNSMQTSGGGGDVTSERENTRQKIEQRVREDI